MLYGILALYLTYILAVYLTYILAFYHTLPDMYSCILFDVW